MKKWLVGLLMSLTLVFALAACSDGDDGNANGNNNGDGGDSDHFDQMKEDGKATIGFADEKPYAYEEDGELKGVAVDVAKEVLSMMGIDNVEGQLADFGQLIPGLQANNFDIIASSNEVKVER